MTYQAVVDGASNPVFIRQALILSKSTAMWMIVEK
jgi:hypothetical protein